MSHCLGYPEAEKARDNGMRRRALVNAALADRIAVGPGRGQLLSFDCGLGFYNNTNYCIMLYEWFPYAPDFMQRIALAVRPWLPTAECRVWHDRALAFMVTSDKKGLDAGPVVFARYQRPCDTDNAEHCPRCWILAEIVATADALDGCFRDVAPADRGHIPKYRAGIRFALDALADHAVNDCVHRPRVDIPKTLITRQSLADALWCHYIDRDEYVALLAELTAIEAGALTDSELIAATDYQYHKTEIEAAAAQFDNDSLQRPPMEH